MTKKALTWIAGLATLAVLASPNVFAVNKTSDSPAGIPPRIVADYLRAVVMAHRHFYTLQIINRLVPEGKVAVSENWRTAHALPLPVQLLQETSEIAELTGPNVRYHLVSQWPIKKSNAPANEFERKGLEAVQAYPNKPYFGTIESDGGQLFGAVYADVAVTKACVECHNSHPSTSKSDFKLGDVMGALVISFPLSRQ
jgi:hypothetical protein